MFRYIVHLLIIISLLLAGPSSFSQTSQPLAPVERQPAFRQERGDLPSAEEREKIKKRIDLIKMWRLTEELNLDEATGSKLFPLLRQYEEKRRELARKREALLFTLRSHLKSANPHEDRLKGLLKEWEGVQAEEQDLSRREKEDLKGILSIEQQAKYLIFQHEFTREIRKVIADVRERRPASSPSRMNIPAKP